MDTFIIIFGCCILFFIIGISIKLTNIISLLKSLMGMSFMKNNMSLADIDKYAKKLEKDLEKYNKER